MSTLHDLLWSTTNDDLSKRLRLLGRKPGAANKQALIEAIKAAYRGDGLRAIWESLSGLEQSAVAEACYAPLYCFISDAFTAKYGQSARFHISSSDGSGCRSWDRGAEPTRLNVFFFPTREYPWVLPEDIAGRLKAFVPKPAEASVRAVADLPAEEGLLIRHTEHDALCEVTALLRLADQGNLKLSEKTAAPSAAGLRMIHDCLANGDFFPPEIADPPGRRDYDQVIGPIKPVAWARLLSAAKFVSVAGTKSKLTPAGTSAVRKPPHEIIRDLWRKWLDNTQFDEFNRIGDIKGQSAKGHMTAKPPRRTAIASALLVCPPAQWIQADEFSRFMQAAGMRFEVSSDPWRLYIGDPQYGAFGYSGYGGWNILQFRYILCLLFEYAATLGMMDIAYVHPDDGPSDFTEQWGGDCLSWLSRYDGLRAFRITPLGAYCLGISETYQTSVLAADLELSVMPNLRIHAVSGTPTAAVQFLLDSWADPVGGGVWQLDPARGRAAVERGLAADDFMAVLQQFDRQPVPETVAGFLKSCERDATALRAGPEARFFDCRDAATAAMICSRKELKDICFGCGDARLAVAAAQEARFRKVIQSLGLGVV